MTAPSFSYSGNVYTSAAAGSVDFALTSTTGNPIAYLEKAHIHVYKSTNQGSTWTELTRPSQWDFVSGGTVARLVTGIATGDWIKVQRITPSTAAYVTFQSSSLLTADQLNDDTLFNTYLNQERYDQGDQSSAVAAAASASAASATSAATAATTTANAASAAAAAATTTANAASASAATALSQSNTAITDSAAALAASANAVTTANTAATNAASAVTTAGTANTNATAAVNTANTAASNASTALSQSTTALSNSATALSTANTANTNASTALTNSSNAVTTANTASTNASNAVTTANTANTNATAALNAVASSLQYVLVANVAAIPSSPANNYAIEVADSTGVESFSPLANRPAGFVGDVGLSVRMQYSTTGPTWNWLNYFPNNAETRYLKLAGGTLTGQLRADDSTSVAAPVIAFDGDTNTGLAHTGADELALVTGGTARLTVDPSGAVAVTNALSVGGQAAVVTNDARLSDTRTPTDGSVTNAKVSASAAIAGSKISPDFGAQNVTTTGTSTAASFIPTSSTVPTNGLYLPSAGSVAISTNSTGRVFVDSSGRVGVATNTPSTVFHCKGDQLRYEANALTYTPYLAFGTPGGLPGIILTTNQATSRQYDIACNGDSLTFRREGTEIGRWDSSGRLGIGTSSVNGLLHLATAETRAILLNNSSIGTAAGDGTYISNKTDGSFAIINQENNSFTLGTNNTDRLTITGGGLVGIGTTSPSQRLHIANTSDNVKLLVSGGFEAALELQNGGGSEVNVINSAGSGNLSLRVANVEAARIDSSRRLLVGTSSNVSGALLQVAGSIGVGTSAAVIRRNEVQGSTGLRLQGNANDTVSDTNPGAYINIGGGPFTDTYEGSINLVAYGSTSAGERNLITFSNRTGTNTITERMRIRSDGNVGIRSSGAADTALAIQGNSTVSVGIDNTQAQGTGWYLIYGTSGSNAVLQAWIRGDGTYGSRPNAYGGTSDLKLKENIEPASSQWDDIKSLQVKKFNFIGDDLRQIGVIAQEVEEVCPGLVDENIDRDAEGNDLGTVTKSVKYSVLYMKAVKALQEAMERIEQLEQRLADAGIA